tara:strand:- start:244 stop:651 length:408 start_codon:yes stop_codon:yes gene_type:complete
MDKQFLKKITCQSPEDLPYISALVSGGKIKSSELKYLPKNKIFLFLIERLDKEQSSNKKKIKSIIKFSNIISTKLKNFKFSNKEEIFELLAIDLLKKDNNYEIILLFSNNRFITLNAEVIDIELTDQKIINNEDN